MKGPISKRPRVIKTLMLLPVLLLGYAVSADVPEFSVTAEEWARPRTGQSLVDMTGLVKAVNAMDASSSSMLLIQYPGGEEGALWASELRDWMVSLGVNSGRIRVEAGLSSHDNITLRVESQE